MEGGGAEAFLGAGVEAGIVIEAVALCGGTVARLWGAVALCRRSRKLAAGAFGGFFCSRSPYGIISRSPCSRSRS